MSVKSAEMLIWMRKETDKRGWNGGDGGDGGDSDVLSKLVEFSLSSRVVLSACFWFIVFLSISFPICNLSNLG